jgi:Na+-transporting methylmalonyl-CoA/oxaloacetate decarboxylase gamma subunit
MGNISSRFANAGTWEGLIMSMIAFSIVFLVTAGLMFVMIALKHFARAIDNAGGKPGDTKGKTVPAAAPVPAENGPSPVSRQNAVSNESDDETAAVIIAAISAMSGGTAKILSCSPVWAAGVRNTIPAWRMAGITDNSLGPRE